MLASRSLPAVAAACCAVAVLSGCAAAAGPLPVAAGRPLRVVAGLYPYAWIAQRVGGPQVQVSNLARPGTEPHDLELTARQVGQVARADLVVLTAGLQPAVDDAAGQEARGRTLDVLQLVPLRRNPEDGLVDPHVWLDPVLLADVADAVAERLAAVAPDRAPGLRERAAALRRELTGLDADLRAGLSSCRRRDLVTSHAAFGYFADRYGLRQVAISGLSPLAEPSGRRLAEVARIARTSGATTVFFERLVSPRLAQQLAREVGARPEVLDPLETAPERGDYVTALRDELATLRPALGCA